MALTVDTVRTVRTLTLIGIIASILCGCLWAWFCRAIFLFVFLPWLSSDQALIGLCMQLLLTIVTVLWFLLAVKMISTREAATKGDITRLAILNSTEWTVASVVLGLANAVLGLIMHVLDDLFVSGPLHDASFPVLASLLVIIVGLLPGGSRVLITRELRRRAPT
jgi:hypothetical protein